MYKLIAIGGKLRGQEYTLREGDNIFGRSGGADHQVLVDGVSKKHLNIYVVGNDISLEDLGSSNGTFVNSAMVKRKKLKVGDKLAIPGAIFQLVQVKERKVSIDESHTDIGEIEVDDQDAMPEDIFGRIRYLFKHKLMHPLYKINEEYDWSVIVGIFLAIYTAVNIALTIVPILDDHKRVLAMEVTTRASFYADMIKRLNAIALEQKDVDRIDTNFLNKEEGVSYYELFDPEGRIVRPVEKINRYTNDPFSVKARVWANQENAGDVFVKLLSRNQIGIAKRIKAYDPELGYEVLVGVIAIKFAPKSWILTVSSNSTAYFRALALSGVLAIILFGIIYYITLRPIDELQKKIDKKMNGKDVEFESKLSFDFIDPLREQLRTIFQRLAEASGEVGESDSMDSEDEAPYIDKLSHFLEAIQGPGMVLDSEKNIKRINLQAEDLTGIRETAAVDESLIDVTKEKGLAATIIDLCDQSASTEGAISVDQYEIQGVNYEINTVGILGKDTFTKGFLVTFNRDDM